MKNERKKNIRAWFRVAIVLACAFTLSPLSTPLFAQTPILGEVEFKGASKVEKTSGVWIDGQYVGYLGELKDKKRLLLLPGDHELAVRQAGYDDFSRKIVIEPRLILTVPVRMQKASGDTWPTVTAELKVDVKPSRAAVFVDGRYLGHAGELGGAFHSMLLSPGAHRIKVELPGYKTFESDVNMVAGQKSVVKTELATGSIEQADTLINQTSER